MEHHIRRFLEGRHLATVGTYNESGSIQLTVVWYILDGDQLYVMTSTQTRKARNVARTGTASVVVDSRERGPLKGAATSGKAAIITGPGAEEIKAKIMARYLSPEAISDPRIGVPMKAHDDCVIQITPGTWAWWDMGALMGGVLETPGFLLPLSPSNALAGGPQPRGIPVSRRPAPLTLCARLM